MSTELKSKREKLTALWVSLIPGFCPSGHQFNLWLQLHDMDADLIAWAIRELAFKYHRKRGQMDGEYMVKFASAVMNRKAAERQTVQAGAAQCGIECKQSQIAGGAA